MNVLSIILDFIEHGIALFIKALAKENDAKRKSEALARLADVTGKLRDLDDLEKAEQDELDREVPPA